MVALGTSWWLEEAASALDDDVSEPLEGDIDGDVCIVGGGFTGLWTALAVKERDPGAHVVLLEAERCGVGPSGRNGGFLHGYWASIGRCRHVLGDEGAIAVARAGEEIIPAVRALGEDVWLREAGMLEVSTTAEQDRALDDSVAAAAAVGSPQHAVPLDREEVAARISSPVFRRGVLFPECATVQPARLVRVLRRKAIGAGVEVHEHTPVRRIEDVRARSIVVATNAWTTGWRPVRRHVTNFGSYVVLTEPVPELLAEIGWIGGEAVIDGRMFIHYFRTTEDGRVLMGSGSGPIGFGGRIDRRFTHDLPTGARAELGLRRLLPALAEVRIERAWGGPIDVSADHLPFFGTVPGTRIHYGLGYSGNGVGPSWLGGQILASLALDRDDEWTALPLATRRVPSLPPEPVKRIGGGLVRAAILSCEEAEEAGRRASLVARSAAAVPKKLGMRIGTR